MFCKNCGKEIKDTEKFCPNCGEPVVSEKNKASEKNQTQILQTKGCRAHKFRGAMYRYHYLIGSPALRRIMHPPINGYSDE